MDTRRSAVAVAADAPARDAFLEALIRLKNRQVPGAPPGFSVYDQFVLVHGAIMSMRVPSWPDPVNLGHWNIGFCPWHRLYIRRFELALKQEVPEAVLPYWDWTDHTGALNTLFTSDFLSELRAASPNPSPVTNGVLRAQVPANERPGWWPAGASGFPVLLQEGSGPTLARGTPGNFSWPASRQAIQTIENLDESSSTLHRYWVFWIALEGGVPNVGLPQALRTLASRTHNSGHGFIGGHMGGAFSPNDPVFFLHHANVDRIWANWQANMLAAHPSTTHVDHYPPATDVAPWNGAAIPRGHRIGDLLWPWVGNATGYSAESLSPLSQSLLPDFSVEPGVTVNDVLDVPAMDYEYAPPP